MNKHLHIVTHDIPFPIDFGGVTDLFCKIKALHQDGINIHLHCFTHKRKEQEILLRYCASVNYYPRKKGLGFIFSQLPYIVYSRRNKQLLKNLQLDDYPILLEGIHCTYLHHKGYFSNRKVALRLHNIESIYYQYLARYESNPLKKCYYLLESLLLKRYEKRIGNLSAIWTVSELDKELCQKSTSDQVIEFLPVFLPWQECKTSVNKGSFCLYHGNLEVNENEHAVNWLVDEVFSKIKLPLVIAGKNPSSGLKAKIYRHQHCCLIENPDEYEMQDLIQKAQINVLPSFNHTGIKLKVLNALYNGRFCIANDAAVDGMSISSEIIIANDTLTMAKNIKLYFDEPFTASMKEKRNSVLCEVYDNNTNVMKIINWL